MTRPAKVKVRDLEFRTPDCPVCLKETEAHGDQLCCERCGLTWNDDGTDGRVDEDWPERCGHVTERTSWFPRGELEAVAGRCFLPPDHADHHAGYDPEAGSTGWDGIEWRYWPRAEVSA